MKCERCGTELSNNAKFCTNCGNKIKRPEYTTPQSNTNVNAYNYSSVPVGSIEQNISDDKKDIGLNILCWFVPIVGIILYFINRKDKPIRSKSNLTVALVSIVLNFIFGILLTVGAIILFGNAAGYFETYPYDESLSIMAGII